MTIDRQLDGRAAPLAAREQLPTAEEEEELAETALETEVQGATATARTA